MKEHTSIAIPKFLIILVVMILISIYTITNSTNALQQEPIKSQIYPMRAQGSVNNESGCPHGYTVQGILEDECAGKEPVTNSCPDGFFVFGKFYPSDPDCVGNKGVECKSSAPKGYSTKIIPPVFGSPDPDIACVGPFIKSVTCPAGFRVHSDYPDICVGPRKF
jgi:hypothetical protein